MSTLNFHVHACRQTDRQTVNDIQHNDIQKLKLFISFLLLSAPLQGNSKSPYMLLIPGEESHDEPGAQCRLSEQLGPQVALGSTEALRPDRT